MKERPIIFSAPMVRAILAGAKTQTRRVMKPQFAADAVPAEMPATDPIGGWVVGGHSGVWWCDAAANPDDARLCPYGQPGDRLWVREAWAIPHSCDHLKPSTITVIDGGRTLLAQRRVYYEATEGLGGLRKRPSIYMPRWASRITLEVTGVRVERLQDISEADARAEGISRADCPDWHATTDYRALWESINGPSSWAANPWVWVVEFKRLPA